MWDTAGNARRGRMDMHVEADLPRYLAAGNARRGRFTYVWQMDMHVGTDLHKCARKGRFTYIWKMDMHVGVDLIHLATGFVCAS